MFFSTPSGSQLRPRCATPSGSADQTVPPYGGYSPSLHEAFAPPSSVYQQPDQTLMDTSASAAVGSGTQQPFYQNSPYGVPMGSGSAVSDATGSYSSDDWGLASRGSVIMVPSKPVENRRKGGRKPKNDKLPPEEEEKRRVRRERNKVAAAKCRQRRVDHTNCLLQETQELEEHGMRMTQEVKRLQQMKEHLEQVLRAHRMHCALDTAAGAPSGHRMAAASGSASSGSALMLGGVSGGGGSALVAGMHAAAAHAHHQKAAAAAAMGLCGAGSIGASGGLQASACGAVHRQSSGSDSGQEQGSSPGGGRRHHHALLSL